MFGIFVNLDGLHQKHQLLNGLSLKLKHMTNDKAINAICQTLSPSKFSQISQCETPREAWEVPKTTYEGTKIVESAKLQMVGFSV
jgi:hypothetical protein